MILRMDRITRLKRREFLKSAIGIGAAFAAEPAFSFQAEKSKLKITGVRVVTAKPRTPLEKYKRVPEKWSHGLPISTPANKYAFHAGTTDAITAGPAPPSIEPLNDPNLPMFPMDRGAFSIEVTTDKGISGLGRGGGGGQPHIADLGRFIVNQDPFDVARLWDHMYLGTLSYGRSGAAIHAISAVDLAIWDVIGKALGMPIYKLIGGATKPRVPSYATLNDILWKKQIGFKKVKLAVPYGPFNGKAGLAKNVELVRYAREQMGPEGDIMLDCWMSLGEQYTLDLADAIAPYKVNWIEEPVLSTDYEGHARLKDKIKTCRITTGEHLFTRYEFLKLGQHNGAHVWQPDIHWSGGLTELMRIASLAAAFDVELIPHLGGSSPYATHLVMATPNSPWAEFFWPPAGGSPEVYKQWEEAHRITRGPEGIYTQPLDSPGFGWDVVTEPLA
jgi:L-rhamnonate dehydratase